MRAWPEPLSKIGKRVDNIILTPVIIEVVSFNIQDGGNLRMHIQENCGRIHTPRQ